MEHGEVLDFSVRKSTDSEDSHPALRPGEQTLHPDEQHDDSLQVEDDLVAEKPVRTGKRLQRMRPADEKLKAIERIRAGESKASVARDINVPESTIRGWCKSETAIRRCLQMKSPYDSESYSPLSASPTSSMGSIGESNLVIDMPGMANNSSDEENNPQSDCQQVSKKLKLETPVRPRGELASMAPPALRQELREMGNADVKTPPDLLWNWLMFNQRLLNQQLLPLQPNGQLPDPREATLPLMPVVAEPREADKPRSADEAIAHGEKFLKWLEDCNDPSVTRFKVMQLKQLLCNLKASKQET